MNIVFHFVEQASVELHGLYSRGQTILEKRFFVDGTNTEKNPNVEIVDQLDTELVEKYIFQGMQDSRSSES